MTTAIRRRRGTTAQHSTFIGLEGETTIDTDKEVVVVHDGTTQGGFPLMRENGSNSALALGSAGTPSLKFTGDTNTGIYSPGADQVAISTGGSGRLFVDASGTVLLGGGAVPGAGNSNPFLYRIGGGGLGLGAATETGTSAPILFYTAATERLRITSTGDLNFKGAGTAGVTQAVSFNGSAPINSLVIDSSGRLGVGTSSPGGKLEILQDSTANTTPAIRITGSAGDPTNYYMEAVPNLSGSLVNYRFNVKNITTYSDVLCLSGSGRVGIGTSTPQQLLQVGGFSGSNGITVGAGSSNYSFIYLADGTGGTEAYRGYLQYNHATDKLELGSAGATAITVDSSQRVGIGSTAPDAPLCFAGATGKKVNFYQGSDYSIGVEASQLRIAAVYNTVIYRGGYSGSETARFDLDGRLLLGTSSQPNTGGTLCVNNGIGIVNNTTGRFASVEHGSGANGTFATITISATVTSAVSSVIFETLMTGFSGVYLDNVIGKYSNQASVTMRNNASAGTSAALAVDGTGLIYTLTITTSVTHPVVKVKVTGGGLTGDITRPTITFA